MATGTFVHRLSAGQLREGSDWAGVIQQMPLEPYCVPLHFPKVSKAKHARVGRHWVEIRHPQPRMGLTKEGPFTGVQQAPSENSRKDPIKQQQGSTCQWGETDRWMGAGAALGQKKVVPRSKAGVFRSWAPRMTEGKRESPPHSYWPWQAGYGRGHCSGRGSVLRHREVGRPRRSNGPLCSRDT